MCAIASNDVTLWSDGELRYCAYEVTDKHTDDRFSLPVSRESRLLIRTNAVPLVIVVIEQLLPLLPLTDFPVVGQSKNQRPEALAQVVVSDPASEHTIQDLRHWFVTHVVELQCSERLDPELRDGTGDGGECGWRWPERRQWLIVWHFGARCYHVNDIIVLLMCRQSPVSDSTEGRECGGHRIVNESAGDLMRSQSSSAWWWLVRVCRSEMVTGTIQSNTQVAEVNSWVHSIRC